MRCSRRRFGHRHQSFIVFSEKWLKKDNTENDAPQVAGEIINRHHGWGTIQFSAVVASSHWLMSSVFSNEGSNISLLSRQNFVRRRQGRRWAKGWTTGREYIETEAGKRGWLLGRAPASNHIDCCDFVDQVRSMLATHLRPACFMRNYR